jgi:plastocyanin
MPPPVRALSIIVLTALLALPLAGCGGDTSGAPAVTPVVDSQATPGAPLTETANDNSFSTTSYSINAGQPYTLTLTNAGKAVHNWHLLGLKGPGGGQIATPLIEGGKSASVTFTIATPGTYHFQCDVHPTQMAGTVVVH